MRKKARGPMTATQERLLWEKQEEYKAAVREYERRLQEWNLGQSAREREAAEEKLRRHRHVTLYGLPLVLPIYDASRGLTTQQATEAARQAWEGFLSDNPDLTPAERACVLAVVENGQTAISLRSLPLKSRWRRCANI